MKLPILAAPITRTVSSAAMVRGILSSEWTTDWIGTAPYCGGDCGVCFAKGQQCAQDTTGCSSGFKVRCYN